MTIERQLLSGLDLGRTQDHTAFTVLERTRKAVPKGKVQIVNDPAMGKQTTVTPDAEPDRRTQRERQWDYRVVRVERFELNTSYTYISEWVARKYKRRPSDDPNMPGEMITSIWLKKVSCGTELKIVVEGLPAAIPVEMCYLGWQDSLQKLIKLVEPEIPG